MQFSKSFFLTAAALIAPIAMQAAAVVPGTTLDVAGLHFSSYSCNSAQLECEDVTVSLIPGNAQAGIEFDGDEATTSKSATMTLAYTLSSLYPIDWIKLSINGAESVFDVSEEVSHGLLQTGAITITQGNKTATLTEFDNQIHVETVVTLSADRDADATFGTIKESFGVTPEPATNALVGGGLMLLGFAARRRCNKVS